MGADPISGIAQGVGSVMAADAQGRAMENQSKVNQQMQREQIGEQKREFDTSHAFQQATQAQREKAYQEAIARGGVQMKEGELALTGAASRANPELAQMEKDIASGNAEQLQQGASQMRANLATSGVRGGQAATLLNRATGEQAMKSQKDINQLKFTDAAQRAAELRAYMAAKAGRGQAATNTGAGVSI